MKRLRMIMPILAATLLTACDKVPAGYEGIKVSLYGGDKGVQSQSLGPGRYYIGFNQELYLFPTFLQNYSWVAPAQDSGEPDEAISIQTSEGLTINADVGITYQIAPENVTKVFQKYRKGVDEITNIFLRNMVRDAMNQISSKMTVDDLVGDKKDDFIAQVNQIVIAEAKQDGIDVDKIYLIGSFRLPQMVVDSINSKIQANQNALKVENEVATSKAEAQKTIIEANAKAEANRIISQSLTPELIQFQALGKWDGKLPSVTGNGIPFINVGTQK